MSVPIQANHYPLSELMDLNSEPHLMQTDDDLPQARQWFGGTAGILIIEPGGGVESLGAKATPDVFRPISLPAPA